jgi:hypothetical protein
VDANVRLITNDGNITLDEVVDDGGSWTLELVAGAGNIVIDDNVGVNGGNTLGLFDIESAGDVHFSGVAATVDVEQLTIGSVTPVINDVEFDAAVNVGGNVDINTNTLTLDAVLSTTNDGTVTVTNSGLADLNAKITSEGTVLFDSTGAISLGADIETTDAGAAITVTDSVLTVDANVRLITNDGNITLDEVLDDGGSRTLELAAGTGNIVIDDNVGVNGGATLGLLDVESAGDVHFSGAAATVDVDQLTIGSVTPVINDVEFDAAVNVGGNVDINTNTLTLDAVLSTTNSGTVTVTNSGLADLNAKITSEGTVLFDDATTGTINLGADIETTDAGAAITVNNAAATLSTNVRLITNDGAITLDEVLDDGGSRTLELAAGAGNIVLDDNVGVNGGNTLGLFDIESAGDVHFSGVAATVDVEQLTIGSVTPVINDVEFDAAVNVGGNVDINTNTLTLDAVLNTTNAGTVTVTNSGLADLNAKITSEGTVLFDDATTGTINLGADIETTGAGAAITVNDSVLTLNTDVLLLTNNGNITLDEVLDDGGSRTLILTVGTGFITVDDNIGVDAGGELAQLRITAAGNVDFSTAAAEIHAGRLDIGNPILGDTPVINDVHFSGLVKTDTGDITVQGSSITVDGVLDTTDGGASGGSLIIGSGVTLNATPDVGAFDIFLNGLDQDTIINSPINDNVPVTITATRDVIINADVTTTSGDLSVIADFEKSDPLGLGYGGVVINNTGSVSAAGGNVSITGTAFTNEGGAGVAALDTYIGNAVSVVNDGAADQISAGGTITLQGSGLNLAGNQDIVIEGLITGTAAGAVTIQADDTDLIRLASTVASNGGTVDFLNAVLLTGAAAVDTTDGGAFTDGATITFQDTVDGANDLSLNAGDTGAIDFNAVVGGAARIGNLSVTNVNNLTAAFGVTAASLSQSAGQGASQFDGAVNTNGAAGIDLNGNNFTFNDTITTTSNGTVTITNAGLLVIAAVADLSLDGAFLQDGAGPVQTGADIGTSDDDITFNGPVTLTGDVEMDTTGTAAGDITFNNTIDMGGNNLILDAGSAGNVTLAGALSNGGDLTVRDGAVQSYQALTLNTLEIQDATTGITLNGNVAAAATITVNSGGSLTQNGQITSGAGLDYDAGGALNINNAINISGTVDVDSTATTSIAAAGDITAGGAVTFGANKAGALSTAGDIDTSDDAVTFNNAVTLTGNIDVDTTASGDILFGSTINMGGFDLALDAGSGGNVTLAGAVSNGGDLTVRDGAVQSYQSMTLNALEIQDATTSVSLNGAIGATSTISVNSGGTLTQNGPVTSGTDLDYDATGVLTTNGSVNVSGTVTMDAATVNINNDIISTGASINLTSAGNMSLTNAALVSAGTALALRVDSGSATASQLDLGDATLDGTTITLTGGADGGDTLLGQDLDTNWVITGADAGTVANANITTTASADFNAFQHLTGGTANDSFNITTGSISGNLDGDSGPGTGTDTLSYAGGPVATITLTGTGSLDGFQGEATNVAGSFDNINDLIGSTGTDTLIADIAAGGTFTVQAGNDTYVNTNTLTFNGLENLTGVEGDDTFNITETHTGNLDGADGNNTINISADLTGDITTGDGDDNYVISATVDGSVTDTDGTNTYELADVTGDITGGAGDDTYTFTGSVDGILAAGTGANSFTFVAGSSPIGGNVDITGDDTWNHFPGQTLTSGEVTGTGSLTVPDADSGELTIDATDLALPTLTGFTGNLILGGIIAPATLPLDGNTTAVVINTERLQVNEPILTGGNLVLLAQDIFLNSESSDTGNPSIGAGIATGDGTIVMIAVAVGDGLSGEGTIVGQATTTTIVGERALFIATGNFVDPELIEIYLGDNGEGKIQIAVAPGSGDPSFGVLEAQSVGLGDNFDTDQDGTTQDFLDNADILSIAPNLGSFITLGNFVQESTAVQAILASNLIGLQQIGFIDTSLFEEELSLYGVIGRGIALALAQCEELEGCAPNVTEEELDQLIAGLQARIDELERRLAETENAADRRTLEALLAGYRQELANFLSYKEQLLEYTSGGLEEDLDDGLGDDAFGEEIIGPADQTAVEVARLNRILEVASQRLDWLESLKTDPESRARLGVSTGIELTLESLDQIIEATRREIESLQSQIRLLLEGTEAGIKPAGKPEFMAAAGDIHTITSVQYGPSLLQSDGRIIASTEQWY